MKRNHRISFTVTDEEKTEIMAYCQRKKRWPTPSHLARDAIWQLMARNPIYPKKYPKPPSIKDKPIDDLNSAERLRALKGYVYLIQSGDYYKIGVTRNHPHERAQALDTAAHNGADVVGFLYVDMPYAVEAELHKKYSKYRKRGEWFAFETIPEEFL